jgi:hypothetical protein
MTDDENATASTGTTRYHPATVAERTAKGTSADIISRQAAATAAKTARLRAAREARDVEKTVVDAEAVQNALPKKLVKTRTKKA